MMNTHLPKLLPWIAAALALPVARPAGQEPEPPDRQAVEWPELTVQDAARVKFLLRKLDGDDAEQQTEAEAGLVEIGAGAAPDVLRRLGDRKLLDPAPFVRVLDRTVGPDYAPLLAQMVTRKQDPVRVWVVGRLARFHDPEMAPVFRDALKDKNGEVVFRAALGLCGLGDLVAIDRVFVRCREGWSEVAELCGDVLPAARGKAAADRVLALMKVDDEGGRIAGLRLMRSLAPEDYAGIIRIYLDAEQHSIKKEAINALRAVVDGDPPLEKLSVFQAIDMAKQWKARL